MSKAEPPYFFRYVLTNNGFPLVCTVGVQSLQLKMPLTFLRPTLLGKSTGAFAPLAKKRNFGLYLAWISALTWLYASTD